MSDAVPDRSGDAARRWAGQREDETATQYLSRNGKIAMEHKGKNGYYKTHSSGDTWDGGCPKCRAQRKAGTHPLA